MKSRTISHPISCTHSDMTPTAEETVRFTVDLPLSLHQQFSALAERQGISKAELFRLMIENPKLGAIVQPTPLRRPTKRFTVDLPLALHEAFSIQMIRRHQKKAVWVRGAIAQLLKDMKDDAVMQ